MGDTNKSKNEIEGDHASELDIARNEDGQENKPELFTEQGITPDADLVETAHNTDKDPTTFNTPGTNDPTIQNNITVPTSQSSAQTTVPQTIKTTYEEVNPGILMKEDPGRKDGARKIRKFLFGQASGRQAA